MTIRYIGSKARVVDAIVEIAGRPSGDSRFVDAFAGTGVVAEHAARRGWPVRINDHLYCASVITAARVTAGHQVPFLDVGGIESAIEQLNAAPEQEGFMWREYSPASIRYAGVERRYFTERNATKIDGARRLIHEWSNDSRLSVAEERVLIAALLTAANRVANIAGTYGCYLSHWTETSMKELRIRPPHLLRKEVPVEVFNVDVYDVPTAPSDVVYFDPPYTKRQYAAYYHVLETVALGDSPEVEGVTGLRPWRHKASPFCYKSKALGALSELMRTVDASRVLLSYSSEGHVPLDALTEELSTIGEITVHELGAIGRYRPNQVASDAAGSVDEVLLELSKTTVEQQGV